MKTFKLCSLSCNKEGQAKRAKSMKLIDGLIINKENEGKDWLIEAVMEPSEFDFFENSLKSDKTLTVKATITDRKNRPVPFEASVHSVNVLESNTHVLLNATRIQKTV
jgi:hypothetical protein